MKSLHTDVCFSVTKYVTVGHEKFHPNLLLFFYSGNIKKIGNPGNYSRKLVPLKNKQKCEYLEY